MSIWRNVCQTTASLHVSGHWRLRLRRRFNVADQRALRPSGQVFGITDVEFVAADAMAFGAEDAIARGEAAVDALAA